MFCAQDSAGRARSRALFPPHHIPEPPLLSRPWQPSPDTPGGTLSISWAGLEIGCSFSPRFAGSQPCPGVLVTEKTQSL